MMYFSIESEEIQVSLRKHPFVFQPGNHGPRCTGAQDHHHQGPIECAALSMSSRSFIMLKVTCLLGLRFLLLVPWVRLVIDLADSWENA